MRRQLGPAPTRTVDTATKTYVDTLFAGGRYSTTIGDGSSTSIVVTHNLGTRGVVIAVFDSTTYEEINCDKFRTSINTVTLIFATAPATNAYTVVVAGNAGTGTVQSTVVEYFTTQASLPVPAGVTGVWIECLIGAGGGGGSGRRGAAGTVRGGGGGGGGCGMIVDYFIPVSLLSSTFALTLPAGQAGGAAVTTNDTDGNPGALAAQALFSSGSLAVQTWWGSAAGGGTNGGANGGLFAQSVINANSGANSSPVGQGGGQGGTTFNGGASGGGSGGGITSGDVAGNGGYGGYQLMNYATGTLGIVGIVGGSLPTAGAAAVAGLGGLGAGGGAASITGAAQAGATGTGYGAGGGGGGASLNGNNSGAGGAGGPSYCRLRWVYI